MSRSSAAAGRARRLTDYSAAGRVQIFVDRRGSGHTFVTKFAGPCKSVAVYSRTIITDAFRGDVPARQHGPVR
jgi:hypothetical protein